MRIIINYCLFAVIMLTSCRKPKATTVVEEKSQISSQLETQAAATSPKPTLQNQKAFTRGEQILHPDGKPSFSPSQLKVSSQESAIIIGDRFWKTDFERNPNRKKVVFFSTQRGNEHFPSFENLDVSDMKGYAFSPLITYLDTREWWKGGSFLQHHVYIPADEEISVKSVDNMTYYIKPAGLTFNPASHLPQYYQTFPDYAIPSNKVATNLFKIADRKLALASLRKGTTYIAHEQLPTEKQLTYDYDQWLYESGCPKAYTVSPEAVSNWLAQVNEKELLRNFVYYFYEAYKNYGVVVLNWEALAAGFYGPGVSKVQRCFEYWEKHPHKAKIAVAGYHGIRLSRVNMEGNAISSDIDRALAFNGNFAAWEPQKGDIFQTNSILAKYADYQYVGGYLNYPTNYGYLHHLLTETMLNRKFFPQKKSIVSFWHNQEYINDFELGWTYFVSNGQALKKTLKPTTFPDAMYNAAVWGFTIADGGEIWSEPYPRTDDTKFYGWGENTFDVRTDRKQPDKYGPKLETYAEQNFQNIDWWEAGKWAVSQNKEIIEANTPWVYLTSRRENGSWSNAKTALPHHSLYAKTPLVAMKKSGNSKLILVYDAWNDPLKASTIEVNLGNGQTKRIEIKGRYTSVVRIED